MYPEGWTDGQRSFGGFFYQDQSVDHSTRIFGLHQYLTVRSRKRNKLINVPSESRMGVSSLCLNVSTLVVLGP